MKNIPLPTIFLLLLGVAIRLIAVGDPIIDGHHLRQTQTADAIASTIREGGFPLDSRASWRGDQNARIVQEFPVYTHAVALVARTGVPLTVAGKLVTVFLWVLAFFALQAIWRRLLTEQETLWANLLFVLAPLSVFFGQAVMPESLVLLLTYGFIALWLKHYDTKATLPLLAAAAVALLGLLVKPPAYFYLGVFAFLTLATSGQWKRFLNFRYYLIGAVLVIAVKLWMDYSNEVSMVYFSRWSASENIERFMGPLSERVNPGFWFKIFAYNFFMVATPIPFVLCLGAALSPRPPDARADRTKLLICWWISLLVFVLVFGPHTAGNHSYYNLPMLAPFAALFGVAAVKVTAWAASRFGNRGRLAATAIFAMAVILGTLPITLHIFGKDTQTYNVALWIRNNTAPDELTVVRFVGIPTPDVPTASFYAERNLWIWSPYMNDYEHNRAIETSAYAVRAKFPPANKNPVVRAWHRFRGFRAPDPEVGFPPPEKFEMILDTEQFSAFKRRTPNP